MAIPCRKLELTSKDLDAGRAQDPPRELWIHFAFPLGM